jgi:hypothetical protein
MGPQISFTSLAWQTKGKTTRRERFLAEMNGVISWAELLAVSEPHYPKAGNGTRPNPLERMLRIYFLQQWYNLSDPSAEEALYDSEAMRRCARIELGEDAVRTSDRTAAHRTTSGPLQSLWSIMLVITPSLQTCADLP